MGYKIGAYVLNMRKGGGDAGFDVKTIGVWPGRELTDAEGPQEGARIAVFSEFQAMTKGMPDKSKPMFFAWKPTAKEKTIFASKFRGATLHIRVHVMLRTEEAYPARYLLNFDGVKVIRIRHKNGQQHVEVSYKEFFVEDLS
ncbi:MAG: hypothetical protein AB7V18_00425 [Pyrinomonadaceae bacterium]